MQFFCHECNKKKPTIKNVQQTQLTYVTDFEHTREFMLMFCMLITSKMSIMLAAIKTSRHNCVLFCFLFFICLPACRYLFFSNFKLLRCKIKSLWALGWWIYCWNKFSISTFYDGIICNINVKFSNSIVHIK